MAITGETTRSGGRRASSSDTFEPEEHREPEQHRKPGRPTLSNEQLLDHALDLFLDQGFERTSIDAITASAGMAKRTVYARYGDKTTLFKAALTRAIEEWIVSVERLRAVETNDLEQTLLAIGRILMANIMTPAGLRLLRLTNAESARMPEIGVFTVSRGTDPTLHYLTDLFGRYLAIDGQPFAQAQDAAAAFLNLVIGGPANQAAWGAVLDDAAIDHSVRYSVELFLHGVRPDARSAGDKALRVLDEDNQRLKKILAETMIALDRLREPGMGDG